MKNVFADFGEPVSLQKRSVPLTDEDSTESALKTLEELVSRQCFILYN